MKRALITAIAATLLLSACFQHTFLIHNDAPAEPVPRYVDWNNHVLWGLIDTSGPVDVDAVCPDGVAIIHNEMSVINSLLAIFTGGLYTPTTTEIYCTEGRSRRGY